MSSFLHAWKLQRAEGSSPSLALYSMFGVAIYAYSYVNAPPFSNFITTYLYRPSLLQRSSLSRFLRTLRTVPRTRVIISLGTALSIARLLSPTDRKTENTANRFGTDAYPCHGVYVPPDNVLWALCTRPFPFNVVNENSRHNPLTRTPRNPAQKSHDHYVAAQLKPSTALTVRP
ncbi:hypothetical protein C8R43DRAFT_108998 [Mycena crocata]|nr:hypothetical protein C8R43DRAFT_108998 [Mycena crocata]